MSHIRWPWSMVGDTKLPMQLSVAACLEGDAAAGQTASPAAGYDMQHVGIYPLHEREARLDRWRNKRLTLDPSKCFKYEVRRTFALSRHRNEAGIFTGSSSSGSSSSTTGSGDRSGPASRTSSTAGDEYADEALDAVDAVPVATVGAAASTTMPAATKSVPASHENASTVTKAAAKLDAAMLQRASVAKSGRTPAAAATATMAPLVKSGGYGHLPDQAARSSAHDKAEAATVLIAPTTTTTRSGRTVQAQRWRMMDGTQIDAPACARDSSWARASSLGAASAGASVRSPSGQSYDNGGYSHQGFYAGPTHAAASASEIGPFLAGPAASSQTQPTQNWSRLRSAPAAGADSLEALHLDGQQGHVDGMADIDATFANSSNGSARITASNHRASNFSIVIPPQGTGERRESLDHSNSGSVYSTDAAAAHHHHLVTDGYSGCSIDGQQFTYVINGPFTGTVLSPSLPAAPTPSNSRTSSAASSVYGSGDDDLPIDDHLSADGHGAGAAYAGDDEHAWRHAPDSRGFQHVGQSYASPDQSLDYSRTTIGDHSRSTIDADEPASRTLSFADDDHTRPQIDEPAPEDGGAEENDDEGDDDADQEDVAAVRCPSMPFKPKKRRRRGALKRRLSPLPKRRVVALGRALSNGSGSGSAGAPGSQSPAAAAFQLGGRPSGYAAPYSSLASTAASSPARPVVHSGWAAADAQSSAQAQNQHLALATAFEDQRSHLSVARVAELQFNGGAGAAAAPAESGRMSRMSDDSRASPTSAPHPGLDPSELSAMLLMLAGGEDDEATAQGHV